MKRKILIYLTNASSFEEYSNMIACDLLEKIDGEVLFYHTLVIWSQDKFGMITLIFVSSCCFTYMQYAYFRMYMYINVC